MTMARREEGGTTSAPERVICAHLYAGELHEDFTVGSVVVAELSYSLGRHYHVRLVDLTRGTTPYESGPFSLPMFAAENYRQVTDYQPTVWDFEKAAV